MVNKRTKGKKILQADILEVVFKLILNKQMLLKFISDFSSKKSDLNSVLINNYIDPRGDELSFSQLKTKINKYAEVIFTMDLGNYLKFNDYYCLFFVDNTNGEKIVGYEPFLDEIIFEILYNIRKQYHYFKDYKITQDNKMRIEIKVSGDRISFENNYANLHNLDKSTIIGLNKSIQDKETKKGLNLINTICEILYQENCKLDYNDDIFQVSVPLKKQKK